MTETADGPPALADDAILSEVAETVTELRAKAAECRGLADKPNNGSYAAMKREARLTGKASAYDDAANMIAAALLRAGMTDTVP